MKYLYLIIRHIFPRKKWRLTETITRYGYGRTSGLPQGYTYVYHDQFGHVKTKQM